MESVETAPLERKHVHFLCCGAVRKYMCDLADITTPYALQMHQVLDTVFSRSPSFTTVSKNAKSEHWWVYNEIVVQSSAGTVFFGIDRCDLFGDMITDDEKEWNLWVDLAAQNLEALCNEIAIAVQETIRIKVYWEIKKNAYGGLELNLLHKQGFVDCATITDSNGVTQHIKNPWDPSDVEEL